MFIEVYILWVFIGFLMCFHAIMSNKITKRSKKPPNFDEGIKE